MKSKKNPFYQFSAATLAALTLASFTTQSAQAASGSWQVAVDGNWGVNANWNGATFPNGEGQAANFSINTPDLLITTTLDANYTVSSSAINSGQSADWLVTSPSNTLTFDHTGVNNSSIANNFNGSSLYTLDTNILLNSNLVLSGNGNGNAKVTLGAVVGGRAITGTGNITINNTSTFGAGVMTINSNINTSGGIFNTSSQGQNHVIAGAIGTTVTGVTQNGTKTMTLSGNNTYTSPTTVTLGTLQAGVASVAGVSGAFGNNSAVTIADAAAALFLNNFNTQIGSLAGGGAVGGSVSLGSATLTTGGLNTDTAFAGAISGGSTSGLTKVGNGTFTLTGNNTPFTGAINLGAGTLVAGRAGNTDIGFTSAVNLNGGNLVFQPATAFDKTYNGGINVNNAGILSYDNPNITTQTLTLGGTNPLAMSANLTVKNTSDVETLVNAINISRPITGAGKLAIETYNNIDDSGDNFGLGRVQISGSNSAWNGNLEIASGTVSFSGDAALVDAAGSGIITIGATGSSAGAGLTFFPTGTGVNVSYDNNITVNTGALPNGFRAIKGSGFTNHRVTFTGTVTLNGDLTLDHSWGSSDNRITLDGVVSGNGGLTITRATGHVETTAVLTKANTYTGPTVVKSTASLAISSTGSLTSNITVESTGRIGGDGGTSGNLTLAAGANFFFFYNTPASVFDVGGTVTLDNSFGIANLRGGSRGEAVPWATIPDGTYTLIGTTASTFSPSAITNFGLSNAANNVGGSGKTAYFQNGGGTGGGGLQLVVTSAVSGYDAWKSATGATGGFAEDHDNDGVDNGTEFFLFGDASAPSSTGFTALPGVTANSVIWVKAASGYDGTYGSGFVVETSTNLAAGSWSDAVIGTPGEPGKVNIAGNNVTYTFPAGTRNFARLKVTGP